MAFWISLVSALAVTVATAQEQPPESRAVVPLTAADMQIVTAALEKTAFAEARRMSPLPRGNRPLAVVPDRTLSFCREGRTDNCLPRGFDGRIQLTREASGTTLIERFRSRNAVPSGISDLGRDVAILPPGQLAKSGRRMMIQFSAPAVDRDKAIIYVRVSCGPLCGKSWLVALERRAERFQVRRVHLLTVS